MSRVSLFSKRGGGFFCGQKESLCVSLFSERGLSFSFALLGMLDFLRFGANKNTEFLHKTVPVLFSPCWCWCCGGVHFLRTRINNIIIERVQL